MDCKKHEGVITVKGCFSCKIEKKTAQEIFKALDKSLKTCEHINCEDLDSFYFELEALKRRYL